MKFTVISQCYRKIYSIFTVLVKLLIFGGLVASKIHVNIINKPITLGHRQTKIPSTFPAHNGPRDLRLSASWGLIEGPPQKSPIIIATWYREAQGGALIGLPLGPNYAEKRDLL